MNAHYFQHVPFEDLGSIRSWLEEAGYTITRTPFFESARLPSPDQIGLLIVLGGPMSVNDESQYPWLAVEKKFIRDIISSGKPVLGICLGAQLIACALGAKVYPNSVKEIGWFPIRGVYSGDRPTFHFPQSLQVFHWHGETFDMPPQAIRIAKSDNCENQAFQWDRSVIGLQFHLETTPEAARDIVTHCREALVSLPSVQNEKEILSAGHKQYQVINDWMGNVLAYLVRQQIV